MLQYIDEVTAGLSGKDDKMGGIAICDDNMEDRKVLRSILEECVRKQGGVMPRIKEYSSGETLLADIEEGYEGFELLFLDIFMGELTGMEIAYRLKTIDAQISVIFLTTSPDFAVESYEVEAKGYLLKPLQRDKLEFFLAKLMQIPEEKKLVIKVSGSRKYVPYGDILYIESSNNDVLVHMRGGGQLRYREKLNNMEEKLDDRRFLRCHQSFLVNMDLVASVDGDFVMEGGSRVPIRVRHHKTLADQYYRYFVERAVGKEDENVSSR